MGNERNKRPSHKCQPMIDMDKRQEDGDLSDNCFYGNAICDIQYGPFGKFGRVGWVAHNEEYETFINYCPFCGAKLEAANGD